MALKSPVDVPARRQPAGGGEAVSQKPTHKKIFVSSKAKAGCHVQVSEEVHMMRDQKLLRMRSTLGGIQAMMRQPPCQGILPVNLPPNVSQRLKDRPLSSYLRAGKSANITPTPHLLDPIPSFKGNENFKTNYHSRLSDSARGGESTQHKTRGGDFVKMLNPAPTEQILPGKSWSHQKPKRSIWPSPEPVASSLDPVGPPDLAYALEVENGSEEKDWWQSPGVLLDVTARTIRMLPQHFIVNGAWERVVVTMCNLHFLCEKMISHGLNMVMKDLNTVSAGLEVECNRFPDLKSWQDIYGTWRTQCLEYLTFFQGNMPAISADIAAVFSLAIAQDWGTCSQDARFALEQVQKSVHSLRAKLNGADEARSDAHEVFKIQKLVNHVRIAYKHGLHRCDWFGLEEPDWKDLVENVLKKTVSPAWFPCVTSADTQAKGPEPSTGLADSQSLHASLTKILLHGMKVTNELVRTPITCRREPRWYSTQIHQSYLVNDIAHLLMAIDAIREGSMSRCLPMQRPSRDVGLYISTMGSMTFERQLLTQIVLPAVAKCLSRVGVFLSWTDLRSAGPEKEFSKNCVIDAIRAMNTCRLGHKKLFTMFLTADSNMLSEDQVYKREKVKIKKDEKQTLLDKATLVLATLQRHLQERFSSIFEAWTFFDINGDWNVTKVEFFLEYKKLKIPMSAKEVLDAIDKDGYGDIDVHEFVRTLAWHDLPGGGSVESVDKAVAHHALRRKTILKEVYEKISGFDAVRIEDDGLLDNLQTIQNKHIPLPASSGKVMSPDPLVSTLSEKPNRVTTKASQISTKSAQPSASVTFSQKIVQDSVLGPELLQEAAREEGLEWVGEPAFINCRLQRLEVEHAFERNRDKFEAIVFERTNPDETRSHTCKADHSTQTCLGDNVLKDIEAMGKLHKYSLQKYGPEVGSFALKAAFATIDAITENLMADNSTGEGTKLDVVDEKCMIATGEIEEDQRLNFGVSATTADPFLWQQERILQRNTLQMLQHRVQDAESKLDVLWGQGNHDDLHLQKSEGASFSREDVIKQLAEWVLGESQANGPLLDKNQVVFRDVRGPMDIAFLTGEPGCGLSSVCAMLIKHLNATTQSALGNGDAQQSKNPDVVVLSYFRRSERNLLEPSTYLLSEIRGQLLFASSHVGLQELPRALYQEVQSSGRRYLVVLDGLSPQELAQLLSGCEGGLESEPNDRKAEENLKLIVTCSRVSTSGGENTELVPSGLHDVMSRFNSGRLRLIRPFTGLSEAQRLAILYSALGSASLSETLSYSKALLVCRLEGAALPEFLVVAAAHLKELSFVVPLDEAALAIERTLESLYEYSILPWLEWNHGPVMMESLAAVLLQSRVQFVSVQQLRALLPSRSHPCLMDYETIYNFIARLSLYCNISSDATANQGLFLKSCTLRSVMAKKYKMKFLLNDYELRGGGEDRSSTVDHEASTLTATSSVSLAASMHNDIESEGIKDCDMDAVRSAVQALIKDKLHQKVIMRRSSKPVPPTPKEADSPPGPLVQAAEKVIENEGEEPGVSPEVVASPFSDSTSPVETNLPSILSSRISQTLTDAPVLDWSFYEGESISSKQSMRQKMLLEPTLQTTSRPKSQRLMRQSSHTIKDFDSALVELQRKSREHDAKEERIAPLTHGVLLEKQHMWEALQASVLLPSLDAQINSAENVDEKIPVPDIMLMKYKQDIAHLKARRNELIKLWTGAKMNVLWRAVSVCNLNVSSRLRQVPPGVYTACWHLKLSAGISDFPDINCTLGAEGESAAAGPPVHSVFTVQQQEAVKTGKWCVLVVCECFYVAEPCDVIASLLCQGDWLTGLIIDCFALVPVSQEEHPPRPSERCYVEKEEERAR